MRLSSLIVTLLLSVNSLFAKHDQDPPLKEPLKLFASEAANARPDLPGTLRLDFGFNFLQNEPSNMGIGFFGSKVFNIAYIKDIQLGDSKVSIHPGIGLGLEKYSFSSNVTLVSSFSQGQRSSVNVVNLASIYGASSEFDKTKLAVNYIDVPLEFRYRIGNDIDRGLMVGFGGKVGFLYSAHTKVSYSRADENFSVKTKDQFELNRFRYGITGRVGTPGFSGWYYYGLNTLFKDGKGPQGTEATQFMAGISFALF